MVRALPAFRQKIVAVV